MIGIRTGGIILDGFEEDLGHVPWEVPPEEPCVLCLRMDKKGRCDGRFKCPYLKELEQGVMAECVVY